MEYFNHTEVHLKRFERTKCKTWKVSYILIQLIFIYLLFIVLIAIFIYYYHFIYLFNYLLFIYYNFFFRGGGRLSEPQESPVCTGMLCTVSCSILKQLNNNND